VIENSLINYKKRRLSQFYRITFNECVATNFFIQLSPLKQGKAGDSMQNENGVFEHLHAMFAVCFYHLLNYLFYLLRRMRWPLTVTFDTTESKIIGYR